MGTAKDDFNARRKAAQRVRIDKLMDLIRATGDKGMTTGEMTKQTGSRGSILYDYLEILLAENKITKIDTNKHKLIYVARDPNAGPACYVPELPRAFFFPPPAPPYDCKYCGMPTWHDPSDQTAPPDYCHEADHGEPETA